MQGVTSDATSKMVSGITFDVVIPNGNENEFIERALALGYTEILFLTTNHKYIKPKDERIRIQTGYLIKDTSDISRFRKHFDYIFAPAERKFFEQKVDFMINTELSDMKDSFHYKATSLNQVHADLSQKNNINIVFGFNNLIYSPLKIFGKMCQNALLVKKYNLKFSSFSMATSPAMMRSRTILNALLSVLSL